MGSSKGFAGAIPGVAVVMASYAIYTWVKTFPPVVLVEIMRSFDLQVSVGGLVPTIYALGVGVSGIPAGYVSDRFGEKRAIQAGIIVTGTFVFLGALSTSIYEMFVFMALSGVGLALWTTATFSVIVKFFSKSKGLAVGFSGIPFGAGLWSGPLAASWVLLATNSWRTTFFALTVAVVLCLLGVTVLLQSARTSGSGEVRREAPKLRKFFATSELRTFRFTSVSFGVVAMALIETGFLALGVTYLRLVRSFSTGDAALAASFYGIGAILTGPAAGYLGDRIGRGKVVALCFGAAAVVGYYFFDDVVRLWDAAVCCLLLGVLIDSGAYLNSLVAMQEIFPRAFVGTATGYYYMLFSFASAPAGFVLGYLATSVGWQTAGQIIYVLLPAVAVAVAMTWTRRPKELSPELAR